MKLLKLASFVVVTSFLAPSCATFSSHRLPEVAANPVQASKKVSLSYKMTCGSELFKGAARNSRLSRSSRSNPPWCRRPTAAAVSPR